MASVVRTFAGKKTSAGQAPFSLALPDRPAPLGSRAPPCHGDGQKVFFPFLLFCSDFFFPSVFTLPPLLASPRDITEEKSSRMMRFGFPLFVSSFACYMSPPTARTFITSSCDRSASFSHTKYFLPLQEKRAALTPTGQRHVQSLLNSMSGRALQRQTGFQ